MPDTPTRRSFLTRAALLATSGWLAASRDPAGPRDKVTATSAAFHTRHRRAPSSIIYGTP